MRFSPAALALTALLAVNSSMGLSQSVEREINPLSTALIAEGYTAQQKGDLDAASDLYESALAADPGNRAAFIALAQVAAAQDLPGKAVRLYREALELDPNDLGALAGQGAALVQRGAVEKARANLARIETLCRGACAEAGQLTAALDKGPPQAVLTAEAVLPKPTVSESTETP